MCCVVCKALEQQFDCDGVTELQRKRPQHKAGRRQQLADLLVSRVATSMPLNARNSHIAELPIAICVTVQQCTSCGWSGGRQP